MVQVSFLLLTTLTALASLGAILMFGMGLTALVAGRITLCADCVEGRAARIVGLILTGALPMLLIVLAIFGGLRGVEWNIAAERFSIPFLAAALVLGGLLAAFGVTRAEARAEA